jgi:2-methylcitrate dehydratase PrpD
MINASQKLAQFVHTTHWQDVPAAVRHEALRSLMNYFAVALAACSDPTIDKALRVMQPFRAGDAATLIGRRERFDMLHAAAINAMAANVYDFDDTHIPTIVHPTAPVAAALFALAQTQPVSGEALLLAFIAGVEIECRIANAISPSHYARGWHITSTCGVFGAAAAAAKILHLDEQQIVWALGNAAAQSAGLVETLGTSAKSMSIGNAARHGLMSALLAQAGFEGPAAPLNGTFGYLKVVGETVDWPALDGELPARWQLQRNTYKPYPCGVVLNPVIDACLELAARPDFAARKTSDITRIVVTGHPLLRQRTDRPNVANGRLSQVSAQHAIGVALTRRRAGLPEFSDAAVADAQVRALGAKLQFVNDAGMTVDAARLRVDFNDGSLLHVHVDAARGSLARPLSDRELEIKLRDLCAYGESHVDAEPLIRAVWALAQCADAGSIMHFATAVHD